MFLCFYGNVLVTSFTVILRPLDYSTATRGNQSFIDNNAFQRLQLFDFSNTLFETTMHQRESSSILQQGYNHRLGRTDLHRFQFRIWWLPLFNLFTVTQTMKSG
jgi:hypothetical protein